MKEKFTADDLFDFIVIFLTIGLLTAAFSACSPRPGYVKTKSGWNTKAQKKRIQQLKRNRPEYVIENIRGIEMPATDYHLKNQHKP